MSKLQRSIKSFKLLALPKAEHWFRRVGKLPKTSDIENLKRFLSKNYQNPWLRSVLLSFPILRNWCQKQNAKKLYTIPGDQLLRDRTELAFPVLYTPSRRRLLEPPPPHPPSLQRASPTAFWPPDIFCSSSEVSSLSRWLRDSSEMITNITSFDLLILMTFLLHT